MHNWCITKDDHDRRNSEVSFLWQRPTTRTRSNQILHGRRGGGASSACRCARCAGGSRAANSSRTASAPPCASPRATSRPSSRASAIAKRMITPVRECHAMSMHYRNFGNTLIKQTSHLCYGRIPEWPPLSPLVLPRPPLTTRKAPEGKKENKMTNPSNNPAGPTLADVDRAVATKDSLSATRRRDLRSAMSRVAALLGEEPAHLPLESVDDRRAACHDQCRRRRDDGEDACQRPLRLPGRRSTQRSASGAGLGQSAVVAGLGRP